MRGVVFGFLSFCLVPTSVLAVGYILHVGEYSFNLSQTKYTTPSLAFGTPNDGVWYGSLVKSNVQNRLKFKYNDTTYSLCEPFVDTENYTYDEDGRLIGADANLYLKSTGTQYIDTGFKPTLNSYMKIDFYGDKNHQAFIALVGQYKDNSSLIYSFGIINESSVTTTALLVYNGYNRNGDWWRIEKNQISGAGTGRYTLTLNKRNASIAGLNHTFPNTPYSLNKNLVLFAYSGADGRMRTQGIANIYSCILKDNDVLMRHFVPVPACMRIGDFVVPENGMWDIVNQQFYGNSGTGEFIYGKD